MAVAAVNESIAVVVAGSINTDIVGLGFPGLLGRGEIGYGTSLSIGPGGKSRNMAEMVACLSGAGAVAMVGRSCRDALGLWRYPIEALERRGVDTSFVQFADPDSPGSFPGVALIPVDRQGRNQIYVLPGVNAHFCPEDIDAAAPAFACAGKNGGMLLMSLELPLPTAVHAARTAARFGLRVLIDPGGVKPGMDLSALFAQGVFLVKPNEHEAEILTGIAIDCPSSAARAAAALRERNIENVLVTMGARGAYLSSPDVSCHFPAAAVARSAERDETGCGDQTMAAVAWALLSGLPLAGAVDMAMVAAGMQFERAGIRPVLAGELQEAMRARQGSENLACGE